MTQTNAQLRERIGELIFQYALNYDEYDSEEPEKVADQVLKLLSPPDTGLASVVSEIDALLRNYSKHYDFPGDNGWIRGHKNGYEVALLDAKDALRLALTTGGTGWRPISTAPKDGTRILLTDGETVSEGNWEKYDLSDSEYHATTGAYLGEVDYDTVEEWMTWHGGFSKESPPTMWKPLDPPPLP